MRGIWIAGAMLIAFGALADSQPPSPSGLGSGQKQQQAASSQEGAFNQQGNSPDSPMYVEQVRSLEEKTNARSEAQEKKSDATWNRWYQIATFVMAVFTVVLAFVTACMYWSGRNTAQRQLRAYISVESGHWVAKDNATNCKFELRPIIANNGKTPAYNVTCNSHVDVLPYPLPDNFSFDIPVYPDVSVGAIGPDGKLEHNQWIRKMLSEDEIKEMKTSNYKRLYIYGVVNYTDCFKKNRFVKFSRSITWNKAGEVLNWQFSKQHNDSN